MNALVFQQAKEQGLIRCLNLGGNRVFLRRRLFPHWAWVHKGWFGFTTLHLAKKGGRK